MCWRCIYLQGQVWGAQCSIPPTPHPRLCLYLSLLSLATLAGVDAEGNSGLAWNIYEPEKGKERGPRLCGAAAFAITPQHLDVLTGHLLPPASLPCHHPIPAMLPPASFALCFPYSLSLQLLSPLPMSPLQPRHSAPPGRGRQQQPSLQPPPWPSSRPPPAGAVRSGGCSSAAV